jgi:hemerythrin-like metal-binding protein
LGEIKTPISSGLSRKSRHRIPKIVITYSLNLAMDEASKNTILVVDDTPENIDILVGMLKGEYKVRIAKSGKQAIKIASNKPTDLILLDIMMPEMDGFETCQILKSNPKTKDIPIIFLTAKTEMEDIVRGFKMGAVDYITKPFNPIELQARVNTHLTIQQQKIQLVETEKIKAMTRIFEKFVPRQFLTRIAKEGVENIELGKAESDTLTILFSDIRSFTSLSEKMEPQGLLDFLNLYFSHLSKPIHLNNGYIDKYIGDAIMALFDDPSANDREEARCAIQASVDMQQALKVFNEIQIKQQHPIIANGIGIHSGHAIIGTVGSEERMDSTVLGDTVNVASRLEGLTKTYGVKIIISGDTLELLGESSGFKLRQLDIVKVKGKTEATRIFEVFDCDPPEIQEKKLKTAPLILEGLSHRGSQDWQMALSCFQEALKIFPDDESIQHHIDYLFLLQKNPPSFDWDGVVDLSSDPLKNHQKFNKLVRWVDVLCIGHDEIDNQHQELVKRINTLIEVLDQGETQFEIEEMLTFLHEYTIFHFQTEEQLMEEINYPNISIQKEGHKKFLEGLSRLKAEYISKGNNLDLAYRFQSRLVNWILNHIAKEDKKISEWL